jgi:glycosyltransferase involved in cell wall biosynthesis
VTKISVSIITFNDAHNLSAAAESVRWADEIVVIDTGSTDATLDIARSVGARIVSTNFKSFAEVRNLAADSCSHEWIFSLDPDERCPPEVRDEILGTINSGSARDAYLVPRHNYMMGRWMRAKNWYPNYRDPQLFRKGAFQRVGIVDEWITLDPKQLGILQNAIWHFPYDNLEEIVFKANLYSTMREKKMGERRVSMWTALGHGIGVFLKTYFLKRGFLDGWPGFIIAFSSFEATFYKYAKRYEQTHGWCKPVPELAGPNRP